MIDIDGKRKARLLLAGCLFALLAIVGSNCAQPIPKLVPDSLPEAGQNEPLPYVLEVQGDIDDHSYIFSSADYATRHKYLRDAAEELFEDIFAPRKVEYDHEGVEIKVAFKMTPDRLTYGWKGRLQVSAHTENSLVRIFQHRSEADYVFYRAVPDSSAITRYHIIYNLMALCLDKMATPIKELRRQVRLIQKSGGTDALSMTSGPLPASDAAMTPLQKTRLESDPDGYNQMSEEDLLAEFNYIRYIARKWNLKDYKKLGLYDKRKRLKAFWDQFYATPIAIANEFRLDYLNRVAYARRNLRGEFTEGWKSDRGRVLLIYGYPDNVENFPSNPSQKAYEVWSYYAIQNGVVFCFVDIRGTGDLRLVHATAQGEIRDQNWLRLTEPRN
jgi:GWxTD domain-containing protein